MLRHGVGALGREVRHHLSVAVERQMAAVRELVVDGRQYIGEAHRVRQRLLLLRSRLSRSMSVSVSRTPGPELSVAASSFSTLRMHVKCTCSRRGLRRTCCTGLVYVVERAAVGVQEVAAHVAHHGVLVTQAVHAKRHMDTPPRYQALLVAVLSCAPTRRGRGAAASTFWRSPTCTCCPPRTRTRSTAAPRRADAVLLLRLDPLISAGMRSADSSRTMRLSNSRCPAAMSLSASCALPSTSSS